MCSRVYNNVFCLAKERKNHEAEVKNTQGNGKADSRYRVWQVSPSPGSNQPPAPQQIVQVDSGSG